MTIGRRPKPTALKLAQGVPGHRALPQGEPQPERGAYPPAWLQNKVALDYWNVIAPQLDEIGVLTRIDAVSLALLCDCVARYKKARAAVEKHGLTMVTHRGALVERPEVRTMDRAHDRMLKILLEFGGTPASRARVGVIKPKPKANKFALIAAGIDLDQADDLTDPQPPTQE